MLVVESNVGIGSNVGGGTIRDLLIDKIRRRMVPPPTLIPQREP